MYRYKSVWSSDAPTEDSEKDSLSVEERSCSNAFDEDLTSCSMNQMDTRASLCSISSSMGLGTTTDSVVESSEETDHINDDIAEVNLKVNIRRFNEKIIILKNDLMRAEELNQALENENLSKKKSLEEMTDKYIIYRNKSENLRKMLDDAEKREETCKLDLQTLKKGLQKKVEELEKNKENILNLEAKIDDLTKENAEFTKEVTNYKTKYYEKVNECKNLHELCNEVQSNISNLETKYKEEYELLLTQIQELQNINADLLQSKMNTSDNTNRFSLTPPPYNSAYVYRHSTPYSNSQKFQQQDSLFTELKASGYNTEEAKILKNRDLEEELSVYNKEIATLSKQVDKALQDIAALRNEICVPSVQLVETNSLQTLKQKITLLINLVKTCTAIKESPIPIRTMGEDSQEKPDILPSETKKFNCLADEGRLFVPDKRKEYDLFDSVTSSSVTTNGFCGKVDKSTSPLSETTATGFVASCCETIEAHNQEIIIPIVEALDRIIEIKRAEDEEDDEAIKPSTRFAKKKSIYTTKKTTDWSNLVNEVKRSHALSTEDYSGSKNFINAKGDGLHCNLIRKKNLDSLKSNVNVATDMKTIKSKFKEYNSKQNELNKHDTKFVTIRPNEKTYLINSIVSSTEDNPEQQFTKIEDVKTDTTYLTTPTKNLKIPHRKSSVYHRSFDIESLQTPDIVHGSSNEKRRSISTPDVQDTEYGSLKSKFQQPQETPLTKNQLLNTYRSANNSDSSDSPSPKKKEYTMDDLDDAHMQRTITIRKPIIIAPSKFKLPDSTVNSTSFIDKEIKKTKPIIAQGIFQNSLFAKISENEAAHHSKILSSSPNFGKREDSDVKKDDTNIANKFANLGNVDSNALLSENSNTFTNDILSSNNSVDISDSMDISDSLCLPNVERNNETYIKADVAGAKESRKSDAPLSSDAPNGAAVRASTRVKSCSSGGVDVVSEGSTGSAPPVERAMSSGEDSSAESECDAAESAKEKFEDRNSNEATVQDAAVTESKVKDKKNSPSGDRDGGDGVREDMVQTPPTMNGDEKNNSCQKVTSNSSPQETIKEDENPKAFPSWTDEKLREAGLANYQDIESEISEHLTEEELKKKYTAFSVGLDTDRMTLSKRFILSRRHRDQAEKNFTNEILKCHQVIKELTPLCVDSESVERVERVKQQLEMVARCSHRISCDAETLGAVHQERRVSRAVLLADKYLQNLRAKCEKLAAELAETKKILAENNIVLEENLNELGDDVPRVRYRAVPNNNRTMMARRRASIATISRPLMGSNQDISKELPRQRNSVSGRVQGLRRPSLCYETPKMEMEKLDRTDSSSSIAELRDIFEQAESRRHSREENNNLIRTSVNNLSTITSEHTEEDEVWSNTREDMVPDIANDNETNYLELGQNHRNPLICWLINRYTIWKPMIWGIFIAFLLGFFMNRVVSSSRHNGPPISWWSIEEILSQYIQVENEKYSVPRPI